MAALDRDVGVAEHKSVSSFGALGHADDLGDLAVGNSGLITDDERDAGVRELRAQRDRRLRGAIFVAGYREEEVGARITAFQVAREVGEQARTEAGERLQHGNARCWLRERR